MVEPLKKKHIPKTLSEAMALHEAGQITEAEHLYQRILGADPKDANALLNLSTLHSQRGEYAEAEALIKRLLTSQPKMAYAHFALGNVLGKAGRHAESAASYARASALEPTNPTAHFNRGITLDAMGDYAQALESYERAAALQPSNVQAQLNRANNLYRLQRYEEALDACNAIIALDPKLPLAYTSRGNVYGALEKRAEALADYNQAIALDPTLAVAHNNRGNFMDKEKDHAEVLASYARAIELDPQYVDAHLNHAAALNRGERYEEAIEGCNRALALRPNVALAYDTRGSALVGLKRYAEALADYDQALALQPTIKTTPWNKAVLTLLLGDLEQGLRLYESRWETEFQRDDVRHFEQPLWLGDTSLEGKTLFIHPEQGYGDFIQMSRYFPLLVAKGATVIAETPDALIPLLTTSFPDPAIRFIAHGSMPDQFDLQCPIMSLPLAMGTTLATIPAPAPYLRVPEARQAQWNERLGAKTRLRVGLVWSGAKIHTNDAKRSTPLATLAPLLQLPFEFHSLQREVRDSDMPNYTSLIDHRDQLQDFADTAALVDAMDIVISVDTSVAHLAGGLAKPCWILLPNMPDYRWLLERSDSPWYPTARLFRQPQPHDWPNTIAHVIEALQEFNPRES